MTCWAQLLGGCGGGNSLEHYFTRAIGDLDICYVSGLSFAKERKSIPKNALAAKVLCRNHNNQLSAVDAEATRLFNELAAIPTERDFLSNKRFFAGPTAISVDGDKLVRWLAKTYCNIMTLEKRIFNDDFVKFAFGMSTNCPLYVFHIERSKVTVPWDEDASISSTHFHNDQGRSGLCTGMMDFTWVLADFDCRLTTVESADGVLRIPTEHLDEKPAKINIFIPARGEHLPYAKLEIEWAAKESN